MGDLLHETSRRVETLLDRFSLLPPTTGARADAEELVRVLASLHGECLRRICSVLDGDTIHRLCDDPLIASLFVTHGLHPVSLEERVRRAIASIPGAELVSAHEDCVEVRFEGSSNAVAAIEQAVYRIAPEVLDVRVAGQTISLLEVL
jgi:hypothetical protein